MQKTYTKDAICIQLLSSELYDDKVSYKAEITLDASVMNPTTDKGTIATGKRTIELSRDNIQLLELRWEATYALSK